MKRVTVPIVAAVFALAGCGGGTGAGDNKDDDLRAFLDSPPSGEAAPAIDQATTTTADDDEEQIEAVAVRYVEAFNAGDWAGTCETLSPDGRLEVRAAGVASGLPASSKCADVLENQSETIRKRRTPKLDALKVTGDTATATDAYEPREAGEDTTARFEKVDGEWFVRLKPGP